MMRWRMKQRRDVWCLIDPLNGSHVPLFRDFSLSLRYIRMGSGFTINRLPTKQTGGMLCD